MIKKLGLDRFSALYLWAIFMIWFSITKHKTFISKPTLNLVLSQNVVVGVLALAFLIPLTTGTFDLSIGTMMTLSLAIVSVMAKKHTMPMYWAVPIALGACGLAGPTPPPPRKQRGGHRFRRLLRFRVNKAWWQGVCKRYQPPQRRHFG